MYNFKKLEKVVAKLDKELEKADAQLAEEYEKEVPILVLVPSLG